MPINQGARAAYTFHYINTILGDYSIHKLLVYPCFFVSVIKTEQCDVLNQHIF
uniref:Uncharacterized protein n=1 Tax=Anguilla anguilla TaxID=7936 RepID=A0A0E9T4U3_ANGAN